MTPKGPFDLARSREFFGGWPSPPSDAEAIVMAFPVEGWRTSAAVVVSQQRGGRIVGDIYGAGATPRKLGVRRSRRCHSMSMAEATGHSVAATR